MTKATHDARSASDHGAAALKKLPGEMIDAVEDAALGVRDEALEFVESAHEQVNDLGSTIAKAVRAKPYQSMCIALGVGCVMGLMIAQLIGYGRSRAELILVISPHVIFSFRTTLMNLDTLRELFVDKLKDPTTPSISC